MQKVGVVIGASKDAVHTIQKAKELGIKTWALDGNPNAEGLKYADEYRVVDISDMDEVHKVIKTMKPDFVFPVPIGKYLLTTAYVNETFDLPGIKNSETNNSVDKYLFHKKLYEKNLRQILLELITDETDITQIKMEYPAILKPRFGSGSRDVFFITNSEELRSAYEHINLLEEDYILEQSVFGEEYGVDGAVINGEFKLTLARKKMNTPLPVRQAIAYFSMTKENESLLNCIKMRIQGIVSALEYNSCLIHADIIVNQEDIFIIEISPRPSGHNLHNLFVPLATGIDIAEEYIKFLIGKEYQFEVDSIRCLQIRFFDFENKVVKKIPEVEELEKSRNCNLIRWNCNMKNGEYLDKVINGHSIMNRGFFVIEGNDEKDLVEQSEWILSQFEFEER